MPSPDLPPLKYFAVGDALSRGLSSRRKAWPSLLARRLAKATGRLVSLETGGGDGCTTEELIRTELGRFEGFAPDFVTVLVGAGDVAEGRSRADYQAALEWIYDSVAGRGLAAGRAVAVSIPPARFREAPEMERRAIDSFNSIARSEASARALAWVDLADGGGDGDAAAAADALHAAWADAIWDAVREAWTA